MRAGLLPHRARPQSHAPVPLLPPSLLAVSCSDCTVKLASLHDLSTVQTLTGHGRWVWDAVFSADSCYLVSGTCHRCLQQLDYALSLVPRAPRPRSSPRYRSVFGQHGPAMGLGEGRVRQGV